MIPVHKPLHLRLDLCGKEYTAEVSGRWGHRGACLLHGPSLIKTKHFIFLIIKKKEAVPTEKPSLVRSLLQDRRKWKVQIKRGNREIGRSRSSPYSHLHCAESNPGSHKAKAVGIWKP
jgi:hypothetical protein